MSNPTALWKNWESRVVDDKFPLQEWLGGSDQSAVFLTQTPGNEPQKAAIKLIPTNAGDKDAKLSRWADAAKLSHPHLIRLLAWGSCQIDDALLLYVVMEFAEENLAEILLLRPLTPEEAHGMLQPTAEALAFLHKAGFVHGGIKPSNIMAVKDELKISADGLRQTGERPTTHPSSAYDPPEFKIAGPSPAADIWSLGATLLAVLTQNEPQLGAGEPRPASVPATVPPTLREITRQCLQPEPRQRGTVSHILSQLNPPAIAEKTVASAMAERARPPAAQKRWMAVSVIAAALILAALLGFKFLAHQPEVPAAEPRATTTLAETLPAQAPAPFSENKKSAAKGVVRGRVVHQVLPEVSRSAQSTITGRLTVSVRVEVDSEGNVSLAKLASPGPSQYFATRALAAAGRWKFAAPQLDGQAVASTWILRFQFGHKSNQVFPAELKP